MQIIFGEENAEELSQKYTVLELEAIVPAEGMSPIMAYCIVPGDKIPFQELPQLDNWIKLHHDFVNGYNTQQYDYCIQCIEHLMGKFGGEVDTFYEEILRRINEDNPVD